MITALLSLGSNVEPQRHLRAALGELRERFGDIVASPAYRTPAVGFDGPDFLNAAAAIRTDLDLDALDAWLHALEDRHGRDRSGPRLGDRTLDVDVVFYGDRVVREGERIRIPRPELKHAFVVMPLARIAPGFVDPISGKTLDELWRGHAEYGRAFEDVAL